jgi:acetyl esterase
VKEEALAYLASLSAEDIPPASDMPSRRRALRQRVLATVGPGEPVGTVTDLTVSSTTVRLYSPASTAGCVLVWMHGGGWTLGDLDTYDPLCRALANRAGCAVASVGYRLAPEHRFPAALDDCWAATRWAADAFGAVAVGGDSAGGTLAAAVSRRAAAAGLDLAMQLLVYPVLEPHDDDFYRDWNARYATVAGGLLQVSAAAAHDTWQAYAPEWVGHLNPEVWPLQATDLSAAPPTLVITAEHDHLAREGAEYARRLQRAAVPAEFVEYRGQIHGFFGLFRSFDGDEAISLAAARLHDAFASTSQAATPPRS